MCLCVARVIIPLNQVQTASGLDDSTHLTRLEAKRSLLEFLLHISAPKIAQIAPLPGRRAIRLGGSQIPQGSGAALDLGLVGLDDFHGLVLGPCDLGLAPAAGATAVAMLDEQVGGADLALGDARDGAGSCACAMVGGHVVLELVRVGAGGGFPAGDFVDRVEVVGKVFGVGMANFPVGGETCLSLGMLVNDWKGIVRGDDLP